MNEGLGNSKGNFIRIAVMCGLENDDALHKFIDIIRRRIDAAYEFGVTQGVEEWIKGDSTHDPKDASSIAYHEAVAAAEIARDTMGAAYYAALDNFNAAQVDLDSAKDAVRVAHREEADATAARYMEILTKKESK